MAKGGASVSLERTQFLQNPVPPTSDAIDTLAAEATWSSTLARGHKLKFSGDGRWQPDNKSEEERLFGNAKEAFYEFKKGWFTSQIGMNTFTWGGTDAFNPLDVVNPRQYYDPLNTEKLGVPSVMVQTKTGIGQFEFIYIPRNFKPILPGENSRWLPRGVFETVGGQGTYTIEVPNNAPIYHYEGGIEWGNPLDNNMGARWQLHAGNFDFSLVGFEGQGTFPILVPDVYGTVSGISSGGAISIRVDPHIGLQPNFYRQRLVGGSMDATWGSFIFRVASTYWDETETRSQNDVPGWPGWSQENVLEIERSFAIKSVTLTVIAEGTYNRRQIEDTGTISLSHLLDRAAMLGFRLANEGTWQALLFAAYDTRGNGTIGNGFFSYALGDFWKIYARGTLVRGKQGTQIASYNQNDNVTVGFARSW